MQTVTLLSRHRSKIATAAAAAFVAGALAPVAQAAAPVAEVVSRASGAQGWAPWLPNGAYPGVVTNDGRYAMFSGFGASASVGTPPSVPLYVRDVRSNVTHEIVAQGVNFATSIDRADRLVAFTSDQRLVAADTNASSDVYVLDLTSGQKQLISRDTGTASPAAGGGDALISGDGKSVVFTTLARTGPAAGVWRRTLATNVTTKLSGPLPAYDQLQSISDDGQRYTTEGPGEGSDPTVDGALITPAGRLATATAPRVSPDGRYAAWTTPRFGQSPALVVRTIATGQQSTYAIPVTEGEYVPAIRVLWVAADGSQIAVAADDNSQGDWAPQVWNRATGAFTAAPGPIAPLVITEVNGARPPAISRNGRFTLLNEGALYVADLWGQGLPGGIDLPPANVYLRRVLGFGGSCEGGDLAFTVVAMPQPRLAPTASAVKITLSGGAETAVVNAAPGQPAQLGTVHVGVGQAVTAKVTAVINGQQVSGTWSTTPCPAA